MDLWCYNQSGVTELLIMRDHHYGRMFFKSVKTLGALHSHLWKRTRPSASAFSTAKNVELLGHYSIILKTTYVAIHGTHFMAWHQLSWAGALVQWLNSLLGKSEIADLNPTVAFKVQRNKIFFSRSLVKLNKNLCRKIVNAYFDCTLCESLTLKVRGSTLVVRIWRL